MAIKRQYLKTVFHLLIAQIEDANDIDVAIPTYNLIEYSDIYSKTYVYGYFIEMNQS